jgi:hypothetical protein
MLYRITSSSPPLMLRPKISSMRSLRLNRPYRPHMVDWVWGLNHDGYRLCYSKHGSRTSMGAIAGFTGPRGEDHCR